MLDPPALKPGSTSEASLPGFDAEAHGMRVHLETQTLTVPLTLALPLPLTLPLPLPLTRSISRCRRWRCCS